MTRIDLNALPAQTNRDTARSILRCASKEARLPRKGCSAIVCMPLKGALRVTNIDGVNFAISAEAMFK